MKTFNDLIVDAAKNNDLISVHTGADAAMNAHDVIDEILPDTRMVNIVDVGVLRTSSSKTDTVEITLRLQPFDYELDFDEEIDDEEHDDVDDDELWPYDEDDDDEADEEAEEFDGILDKARKVLDEYNKKQSEIGETVKSVIAESSESM